MCALPPLLTTCMCPVTVCALGLFVSAKSWSGRMNCAEAKCRCVFLRCSCTRPGFACSSSPLLPGHQQADHPPLSAQRLSLFCVLLLVGVVGPCADHNVSCTWQLVSTHLSNLCSTAWLVTLVKVQSCADTGAGTEFGCWQLCQHSNSVPSPCPCCFHAAVACPFTFSCS